MYNLENWQEDEKKQTKIVLDTTMHKQTKICVGHHYALTNTKTTGGKDEPNMLMRKS